MPLWEGRSPWRASSTPVSSRLRRPGRRSRSGRCHEDRSPRPTRLIYKCQVASLLAKSSPAWTNFLGGGDRINVTNEGAPALDVTTRLHATAASQLLQLLSICSTDVWTPTITCPLPVFPEPGEERRAFVTVEMKSLVSCVRVQAEWVFLKADIFLEWSKNKGAGILTVNVLNMIKKRVTTICATWIQSCSIQSCSIQSCSIQCFID